MGYRDDQIADLQAERDALQAEVDRLAQENADLRAELSLIKKEELK